MKFSHFFIRRPIFASVLSILIVLLGAIALFTLPIAQYPEITPPTIFVMATYPGASAKTVADTVATPIEVARDLFEISKGVTYLNCASMAPQLRCVTEAGLRSVRTKASPWTLSGPEWFSASEQLRTLAARVMDTDSDAVALVPAASYGIATAAANLPVATGQTIVILHHQFPSNVYVWYELAKKKGGCVVVAQREQCPTACT